MTTGTISEKAVLSTREFAEILRVCLATCRQKRKRGEVLDPMPGLGPLFWSRSEVEAWLLAGAPAAAAWRRQKARR